MNRPSAARLSIAAAAIAILPLAINIYLLAELRRAERMLDPVRTLVESLEVESEQLRTEIHIPAGIPINLDIPIDERVTVSVDTVLPIAARITVPIRSPLGSWDVPVPIRASVPVQTDLSLRIRHTFRLRTQTPAGITVPIVVGQ